MFNYRIIIIVIGFLFLSGCIPTYKIKAGDVNFAQVNIDKIYSPSICIDNKIFHLKKEANGYAKIPAGERISIYSNYMIQQSGYEQITTYTCNVGLSFIPKKGQYYYSNFYQGKNTCSIELFQEDNKSEYGIKFEPTRDEAEC